LNESHGCLPMAIRWLALTMCGLVVLTLPPTLIGRTVAGRVFSADLVKQELSDRLVNSGALRSAALRSLVPQASEEPDGLGALTAHLDEQDWDEISRAAVPDGWVQSQLDTVVDDVFTWLDGDRLVPDIQLDVEPIKRNLIGAGTESITRIVVESWPDCSLEQLFELESSFRQSGQLPLILCNPPEPIRSVAIGFVAGAFKSGARLMPTTLDLTRAAQATAAADLLEIKRTLRSIRLAAGWAIMIPIILLGLVMAFVVRSWRELARWWGVPLLAAGLLTTGLSIVLAVFVMGWLSPDVVDAGASQILLEAIQAAMRDLIQRGLLRGAVLGGIAAAVGGAGLMATWIWPESAPPAESPSPRTPDVQDAPPSGMFG
jgi:hypothetical protein